jgi:hypothetical protein
VGEVWKLIGCVKEYTDEVMECEEQSVFPKYFKNQLNFYVVYAHYNMLPNTPYTTNIREPI